MHERTVVHTLQLAHTLENLQRKVIKNEILPLFGMPWKSDNIFYAKKYYLWRTEGATFHFRGRQCAHHRQQQQKQLDNNIKGNKNISIPKPSRVKVALCWLVCFFFEFGGLFIALNFFCLLTWRFPALFSSRSLVIRRFGDEYMDMHIFIHTCKIIS